MESKRVNFRVEFTAFPPGAGEGYHGFSTLAVDLYGGKVFHGLALSHLDASRRIPRHAFPVFTRTALGAPGHAPEVFSTERYEVHTFEDHDPLIAAGRALEYHLEHLLPSQLGDSTRIPNALKEEFYLSAYRDQVVQPIHTAVIGMCREPAMQSQFENDAAVAAFGMWKLAVLEPNALSSALEMGVQVQDVLVVPRERVGDLQQILL